MIRELRHQSREIAKVPYYALYRAQLRMICWWNDVFRGVGGHHTNIPPTMMRFRVSELLSTAEFLTVGDGCAQHVAIQADHSGSSLDQATHVLDFGCGCGRILRWLIERYPGVKFHGADVDREAIEWCRKHLPSAQYSLSSFEPPLGYGAGTFDLIYCFSVFTHLDEERQDLWLAELRRLLKPGGLLLITVHGANAAGLIDESARQSLATNGFLHRRSSKFKGILPEWYHTSWHSRDYIIARLSTLFEKVEYVVIPDGIQDIVLAKFPTRLGL